MAKKIFGFLFILVGGALFFFSNYIATQVLEGQQQIDSAQSKVDTGKKLFSLTPVTKDASNILAHPIQKKIDQGQDQVDYYDLIAQRLHIGGVVVAILGVALVIWGFSRKKKR